MYFKNKKSELNYNPSKFRKRITLTVLLVFLITTFLGGISVFIGETQAVNWEYKKPKETINDGGAENVNINNKTIKIYVDEDGNEIDQGGQGTGGTGNTDLEGVYVLPIFGTNLNFLGFTSYSTSNNPNSPNLYKYLQKSGIGSFENINIDKFYYDDYDFFYKNKDDNFSLTTLGINKGLNTKEMNFVSDFRLEDTSNTINNKKLEINDGVSKYKFLFRNNKVSENISYAELDSNKIAKDAFFDEETGKILGPNIFYQTKPQEYEVRIKKVVNRDGNYNTTIQLGKKIIKNEIVWAGPGSEYDLMYRKHLSNNLNNSTWYGDMGYTYKYSDESFDATGLGKYSHIGKVDGKAQWDAPTAYGIIKRPFSGRNDYYLPVEIYNGTIIIDFYPKSDNHHIGIVSTKNAQRRVNVIVGHGLQTSNDGDRRNHNGFITHGYNEWYRLVYNIQTRNGKQIIDVQSYYYNYDGTNGHIWIPENDGHYTVVYQNNFSGWKPNFFNHSSYKDFYIGQIKVIPRDKIWEKGHPGYVVSTFRNDGVRDGGNSNHANTLQDLISNINEGKNYDNFFQGINTLMLPMVTGVRLDTNYRVKYYDKGSNNNINNQNGGDNYSTLIKGYFNAKQDGEYCFAVDGDDYIGIYIDGNKVVEWGGGHGWQKNTSHNGCINLTKGFHNFIGAQEEFGGGDDWVFYVKNPGENNYHVIAPDKGEIYSTIYTDNGQNIDTVNNYIEYKIKNQNSNSKSSFTTFFPTKEFLINKIKHWASVYYDLSIGALKDFAKNLYLNRSMSIYGDDMDYDINSFNANFYLSGLNKKPKVKYDLISSIDRIGGIRNIGVLKINAGDTPALSYSEIPSYYYAKENSLYPYMTNGQKFLYEKSGNAIGITGGGGFRWGSGGSHHYNLYSDLGLYGIKDELLINQTTNTHYDSGDFDYGFRIGGRLLESYYQQDGHRENESGYMLLNGEYSNDKFQLYHTNILDNFVTMNNSYDLTGNKVKLNDHLGVQKMNNINVNHGVSLNLLDIPIDNDNGKKRRFKSHYVNTKVYNINVLNDNTIYVGFEENNPALSCKKIYDNFSGNVVNDWYWIKLDNSNVLKLFCDFRKKTNGGSTLYVDIKKNYSGADALNCWKGNYILNENLECYNPNRYTSLTKIKSLYLTEDFGLEEGGFYSYDLSNKDKSVNSKNKNSTNYRYSLGHKEFMTIMKNNNYPNSDGSNSRYIRLGLNFTLYERQYGGMDTQDKQYMNYSDSGKFGIKPGNRESNVKPGKLYWQEP